MEVAGGGVGVSQFGQYDFSNSMNLAEDRDRFYYVLPHH